MGIITWDDLRRATLAIVLVILPTVLLSTFLPTTLHNYQITGPGLWELKLKGAPDMLIEPLHELRLKPYFFKFRLMGEVESRIPNAALFEKYKKNIERQISRISLPAVDYIFFVVLSSYYGILWFVRNRWFAEGKI